MLKLMRDNLKHLTWVLGLVVLAFVFSVFADYGGQGSWFGGPSGDWAAVVNGETIPIRDFLDAARNLDGYYRNLLGTSYDRTRLNLNIGQQAIGQLVQNHVILAHARSLGLEATPEEIRDAVVNDPNLQGDNGFIGVDRYKSLLRSLGRDPSDYESEVARQVLLRKWIEVVTADIVASDRQVEREIRRRDERADVVFAQFRPGDLAASIEITDDEVAAYYAEHQASYARSEGRSFEMLVFDRLREQREIRIPEEEVRAAYDASLQSRFQIPEQRRASHILIKTPADMSNAEIADARLRAEAALARVRGGEDFAAVAREVSEDTSAPNGGDLGFFGRGAMTVPFEQVVWRLQEIGAVSDIVRTEFGFHVIKLTGLREPRLRPFEEVREELEREVAFRLAGEQVREKAQAFFEAVKDGPESFRDEAARQSRVVTETGAVYPGDPVPGIGPNAEIERALFALPPGQITEPVAISRGYVVARFVAPHPGGAPPLEEIRTRVEADLRNERARARAVELAAEAVAGAGKNGLKEAGEALGFEVQEVTQVARGTAIGSLGIRPPMERAVFSAEVAAVMGPLELDDGPVVFQVTARDEVTAEQIAERAGQMREQLVVTRRQLVVSALTRELVDAADVRLNAEVIQSIDAPATTASTR